jgi:hypothetical protein
MLSQANIKWISELSGVSVEEISGALSKEEEVTLGLVVTQEEEQRLKDDSFKRGAEIRTKDLAKELSLDLDDGEHKDIKKVAEKLKITVSASLEDKYKNPQPGEKEKELEGKLQAANLKYDKLFETHENVLGQVQEKEKAYSGLQKEIKTKERNNAILKTFPEKMKMDRNDALLIFTNTFEFDEVDGNQVIKKDGQIVTDAVGKPEKLENIVPSFVEEKNWLKGAGMGGGDRNQGGNKKGGKTPDEAAKIVREKFGDNTTSPEGVKFFKELISTE